MTEQRKKAKILLHQGVVAHHAGDLATALASYHEALLVDPTFADPLLNIGSALHDSERFSDALATYSFALASRPAWGEVLFNRGNTLLAMDRYEEAIESYSQSLFELPENVEAFVTIGTALESLGRYDEAMMLYHDAIIRSADCAEAHWNLALALLRKGEFEQGWQEFEWRWFKKGYTTSHRTFGLPLWDGRPLNGDPILLHSEQAFGDTLQFSRYIRLVAALGGEVLVEAPFELMPLLSEIQGVSAVIPFGAQIPAVRWQVPLLSLPRIFGTTISSIPTDVPYLRIPVSRKEIWNRRIGKDKSFKIGLTWAGRKRPDPHRSCKLIDFSPLTRLRGVTFYSLQLGEGSEEVSSSPAGMNLIDPTVDIHDFADTAALVDELDLIISIDTAVAHLAGALGKPTFVMVPTAPDWRWMLERSDSPWYPSIRIFRQKHCNEWYEVVNEMLKLLTKEQ